MGLPRVSGLSTRRVHELGQLRPRLRALSLAIQGKTELKALPTAAGARSVPRSEPPAPLPLGIPAHATCRSPLCLSPCLPPLAPPAPPFLQVFGHPGALTGIAYNSAVFGLGYKVLRKGLTPAGVAHAWFLGSAVFAAFGAGGYMLVCLYFIFGTLVRERERSYAIQEHGTSA